MSDSIEIPFKSDFLYDLVLDYYWVSKQAVVLSLCEGRTAGCLWQSSSLSDFRKKGVFTIM